MCRRVRLGKSISPLVQTENVVNFKLVRQDLIPNAKNINFRMFHSEVKDTIVKIGLGLISLVFKIHIGYSIYNRGSMG